MDDDDTKQSSVTAPRREQIPAPKDALLRVFLRALLQHQSATDALGQAIASVNPKGVENAAVDAYSFLVAAHSVLRRLESIEPGAPDDMQTARFGIRANQRALLDLFRRAEAQFPGHELPRVLEQLRACAVFAVRSTRARTDR